LIQKNVIEENEGVDNYLGMLKKGDRAACQSHGIVDTTILTFSSMEKAKSKRLDCKWILEIE